jgi:hypothetical protein
MGAQFRASLEFAIQHWGLWSLAMCRRLGMPMNVRQWASALDRIASWLEPFGGDYGCMLVSVVGGEAVTGQRSSAKPSRFTATSP